MNYPVLKLIFDRHKRSSRTRPGTIEIVISHRSRRRCVFTGVSVLPSEWDGENVTGRSDAFGLNARIEDKKYILRYFL